MAKRRMYDSINAMSGAESGRPSKMMRPNNNTYNLITEDFSEPCGIPYGAHQRDLGNGDYYSMNSVHVGDLYDQVERNMKADAEGVKRQTRPTNW